MSDLYIYLNGARRGPFAQERVLQMLVEGWLQPADLASAGPNAELRPLSALLPAAEEPSAPPLVRRLAPSDLPHLPLEALGPYSRATLAPDEKPFFKTNLHWIIFLRFGLAGLALFLFAALPFAIGVQALLGWQIGWFALPLPAFILVPPALAYASSEFVITDRRVLIKSGMIRRQTIEMFITRIESIAVDQGFLGRILDYGTVVIRGTGGSEEAFEAIARPMQFRSDVQRLQSETTHGA